MNLNPHTAKFEDLLAALIEKGAQGVDHYRTRWARAGNNRRDRLQVRRDMCMWLAYQEG